MLPVDFFSKTSWIRGTHVSKSLQKEGPDKKEQACHDLEHQWCYLFAGYLYSLFHHLLLHSSPKNNPWQKQRHPKRQPGQLAEGHWDQGGKTERILLHHRGSSQRRSVFALRICRMDILAAGSDRTVIFQERANAWNMLIHGLPTHLPS